MEVMLKYMESQISKVIICKNLQSKSSVPYFQKHKCFEESDRNKYLMLVPTNESKEKKYMKNRGVKSQI